MVIERQVEQPTSDATKSEGLPRWKRIVLILSAASVSLGFGLRQLEAAENSADATAASDAVADRAVGDSSAGAPDPVALLSTPAPAPSDPWVDRSPEHHALALGADLAGASSLAPSSAGTRSIDRQMADRVVTPTGSLALTSEPASPRASAPVATSPASGDPSTPLSPLFLKGGLSLFVGFCIGHVLRAFLKLSALVLGLGFLVTIGLQYMGLLDLDWQAAEDAYDLASAKVLAELDSLRVFIAGSLPSAGLGTFGLFAGFKRGR